MARFIVLCVILDMFETSHEALDKEFTEFSVLNLSIVLLLGQLHDEIDVTSLWVDALPEEDS